MKKILFIGIFLMSLFFTASAHRHGISYYGYRAGRYYSPRAHVYYHPERIWINGYWIVDRYGYRVRWVPGFWR